MASYTRQIPPGEEGKVVVKVFTDGYGGRKLTKSAQVTCNDPNHRQFSLTVTGEVEKFVTIEPRSARLFGKPGEKIYATIRIVEEKKYPFQIQGPSRRESKNFRYTLSPIEDPGTRGYLLTVENKLQQEGRYFEQIVLKTDSALKPEIRISVHGLVTE